MIIVQVTTMIVLDDKDNFHAIVFIA